MAGAVLMFAGVAEAAKPSAGRFALRGSNGAQIQSIRGTTVPAGAVPCLSVAGKTGNDGAGSGDPSNSIVNLNIGVGNELLGVAADVSVEAFDPSWLAEAEVTFSSSDPKAGGITLTPSQTEESGVEAFSTEGVVMFADVGGLPQIIAGADGILRLEWSESWNDAQVDPDSQWSNGGKPVVCPGLRLICTNQAACDVTVPVSLQQFSVD